MVIPVDGRVLARQAGSAEQPVAQWRQADLWGWQGCPTGCGWFSGGGRAGAALNTGETLDREPTRDKEKPCENPRPEESRSAGAGRQRGASTAELHRGPGHVDHDGVGTSTSTGEAEMRPMMFGSSSLSRARWPHGAAAPEASSRCDRSAAGSLGPIGRHLVHGHAGHVVLAYDMVCAFRDKQPIVLKLYGDLFPELGPDGRISKRELSPSEALEHLEEERRLAHVAATRAQRRLVVTYVRGFSSRLSPFDWKPQDPAFRSSLPLPEPLLPEGAPNAAMWLRISPKAEDEPDWEHDCALVHM
ncbi:unnamed protein product, partial [Prorocentrum cordatum]